MEGLIRRGLVYTWTATEEWRLPSEEDMLSSPNGYVMSFAHFHERGFVVPSSLGLVRCVILYFLESFIMERILPSELSFFFVLMSLLFMRFLSSFYKNRVLLFLVS